MKGVYINSAGSFLPGQPIGNEQIEDYLGKINGTTSKAKNRILKNNGIRQRYYALDRQQNTTHRNSEMAANAVRDALSRSDLESEAIDLLACATSLPDLLLPGFASMVHGELPELSPLEIVSTQGICCAGVTALNYATSQVKIGRKKNALVVASELASRLFTNTKFETQSAIEKGKKLSFDAEFLRWMLSDGAGALLIQDRPRTDGISLKVEWIELISHANAYPLCMYGGTKDETGTKSWLDYSSYTEAAADGAFDLRQNIRLLDNIIKLGVEGWLKLIATGKINYKEIDWFLCHYSSHFFRSQIVELLTKANCMIPESKWFTNLYTKGNTGCASIYLMLEELFNSGKLKAGEKICCFVPESGRFTTAYMLLEVIDKREERLTIEIRNSEEKIVKSNPNSDIGAELLQQLTLVWLEFERELRSVPIVRKLHRGEFTIEDYKALLLNLRPQVVEGARWISRAASNMKEFKLRSLFLGHAVDEHRDYQMLEKNYVSVGGKLSEIMEAEQNLGTIALSAFIFDRASRENPIDLIGSMFIIEGLGDRLARQWADRIKQTLKLKDEQVSFLAYHGANDKSHLNKLDSIINADWMSWEITRQIVTTAKVTARLYRLQLEEIK